VKLGFKKTHTLNPVKGFPKTKTHHVMVDNSYRVDFVMHPYPPVETGGYSQATPDGVRNDS
jgi:hypothetical protein